MNYFGKRWVKSWRRLFHLVLAALILGTGVGRVHAEAPGPYLVKDVNPGNEGSFWDELVNVGGTLFFVAEDESHGRELYKSDGTETGTVLVKDIMPGFEGSYPEGLTDVNGTLFFIVYDDEHGWELYKSDGTEAGTVLVKDIWPGSEGSDPEGLIDVNGTLFFRARDGEHGQELYKSDGTEAGTVLVKDIRPGAEGSDLPGLIDVNGTLFFRADDGSSGRELWQSDGTEAGTVLVKDIQPGSDGSHPGYLTDVNGVLFFAASDGIHGRELYKSDGTEAGTVMVKDIIAGSKGAYPGYLTDANGVLFFTAGDDAHGIELYKSDGTAVGTVLVKDIKLGGDSSGILFLTDVNGTLFFFADDGFHGKELYKSDGTTAGTVMVKDIRLGGDTGINYLTDVNGTLFFHADDGVHGRELYKSDGTEAGTVMVKDIKPGDGESFPHHLTDVNGTLFFRADDGVHGWELYKSDGTEAGTVLVKDINLKPYNSWIKWMTEMNDTLFFSAHDDVHAGGLWRSNGTESSTTLLADVEPKGHYLVADIKSTPSDGTHDVLFFEGRDDRYGAELYKSDGTPKGTVLVRDVYPGSSSSLSPHDLVNMHGMLFFLARLGLYKSDGTDEGTVRIKRGSGGGLINVNDTLFFAAHLDELWKSDGTEAGTVMIKDIFPGHPDDYAVLFGLTNANGTLFFLATDSVHGWELWTSDGTEAGTVMVKDIRPGRGDSDPSYLTDVDGMLFFSADDGIHGRELYKSDGTEAGTVLVKDINPGAGSSAPAYLVNIKGVPFGGAHDMLYFGADDGVYGRELWRSDGTEAGTVRVEDIYPGEGSSDPSNLTNVEGVLFGGAHDMLFFSADDGVHGKELYKRDGTEGGTVRLGDVYPGEGSSDPAHLTCVSGRLYFRADDGVHGEELWALSIGLDLALTKIVTPTTPVLPGAPLTYTLAFNNASLTAASGVVITDHLPLALTQVGVMSSGASITRTAGITFTWQVEDLAPGEGGVITITGVIDPEFPDGVFTNTATITSTTAEANVEDNSSSAEVTVFTPALRVFKSVQGPGGATANLLPGDVVTYTITLENSLDEVAAGVLMTDPLPAEVSFGAWLEQGSAQLPPPSGTGTLAREIITWGPYSIPPDESVSMAFTASVALGTALAGARVANTAWFSSADAGSGFGSAVFTIKFTDLFLPLVTKKQL